MLPAPDDGIARKCAAPNADLEQVLYRHQPQPRRPVPGLGESALEIARCEKDPKARLKMARSVAATIKAAKRKTARYTPLSKRQDRPDAIAWLLRHHPEVGEAQICKLLGTTKATVQAVRDRTHWKSQDIRPRDPVLLGLCSQSELDEVVARARAEQGTPLAPRKVPLEELGELAE